MLSRRPLAYAAAALFWTQACATAYHVYDASEAHDVRGVYYALPKTAITVEVPIKQTIFLPGRFAAYAPELLGVQAKTAKTRTFAVGEPVTLGVRIEADPDEVYVVQVKSKNPFQTRALEMHLSELGNLTKGKAVTEDTTADFVVATVKTAASIAAKAIGLDAVTPSAATTDAAAGGPSLESIDQQALTFGLLSEKAGKVTDRRYYPPQAIVDRWLAGERLDGEACRTEPKVPPGPGGTLDGPPPALFSDALILALDKYRRIEGDRKVLGEVLASVRAALPKALEPSIAAVEKKLCSGACGTVSQRIRPKAADLAGLYGLIGQIDDVETADDLRAKVGASFGSKAFIFLCAEVQTLLVAEDFPYCQKRRLRSDIVSPDSGPSRRLVSALGLDKAIELYEQFAKDCELSGRFVTEATVKALYRALELVVASDRVSQLRSIQAARDRVIVDWRTTAGAKPETVELILDELDAAEETILESFTGSKKVAVWKARFVVEPKRVTSNAASSACVPLLEIAASKGVRYRTMNAGKACTAAFSATLLNRPPATFVVTAQDPAFRQLVALKLKVLTGGGALSAASANFQMPTGTKKVRDEKKKLGFRYRLPGVADVEVVRAPKRTTYQLKDAQVLAEDGVQVAQLGSIGILPAKAGTGRKSSYDLDLYPSTGGLKKLVVSTSPPSAETVTGLGEAITTIQDAQIAAQEKENERLKAEQEAQDELTLLRREKEILELQAAIEALKNPVPDTGAGAE